MRNDQKIRIIVMTSGLILAAFWAFLIGQAGAFDLRDAAADAVAISGAYMTHLSLHEMGHQAVAVEAGAESPKIDFFTRRNGRFYPGLSTYEDIPEGSKLPYAVGGERMAGLTFEYALESYRRRPTMFSKALMFFSCTDFLVYTLVANYHSPDNDMYDPNVIRQETGASKELLVSIAAAKSLLNAYRAVNNEGATFVPMIWADTRSAAFVLSFPF